MTDPQHAVYRHHHMTLCVGDAQEDYDFHTKVLDLKSVKKTALYDGTVPIYHLYYGNDMGDESTLITCFPMRQSGRDGPARDRARSAGSACRCRPRRSASGTRGSATTASTPRRSERFGEKVLQFSHPCGLDYELVGVAGDERKSRTPAARSPARTASAARTASPCRSTTSRRRWSSWTSGWNGKRTAEDGQLHPLRDRRRRLGHDRRLRPRAGPRHRHAGRSVRARCTTARSRSTRSRSRMRSRRTSRASATPTCPIARTAATSTRCTCARRAARCSKRPCRSRRAS